MSGLYVAELDVMWEWGVYPEPISGPIYGKCKLFGWSIRETTGTMSATVTLLDGADATGLESFGSQLNPSGAARDWLGPQGLTMQVGIFPVISGTVKGAMFVWRGKN